MEYVKENIMELDYVPRHYIMFFQALVECKTSISISESDDVALIIIIKMANKMTCRFAVRIL